MSTCNEPAPKPFIGVTLYPASTEAKHEGVILSLWNGADERVILLDKQGVQELIMTLTASLDEI